MSQGHSENHIENHSVSYNVGYNVSHTERCDEQRHNEPRNEKVNFYNLPVDKLAEYLVAHKKEKYRAQQLFKWVYEKGITDFSLMTNMSKQLRSELADIFYFERPQVIQNFKSSDGTEKFLFAIEGTNSVESVLIPSDDRLTLCISSEVGCNMGCRFCYTGLQKLKRRLTTAQIVGQFLEVQNRLNAEGQGRRISNIVFMGMGEPLDNPDAVFPAIEILTNDFGPNLSRKKITVSTSGIVPLIPLVTQARVRLAVSLNAPNDRVRNEVMPINKRWQIAELLEACREHARATKDRVTLEYVLLKGVTDSIEDARELHRLTRNVPCKINIIPFNEHPGAPFHRPDMSAVYRFQQELIRLGSHVLLRKTMGRDIYAACGQLTSLYEGRPEKLQQDEQREKQQEEQQQSLQQIQQVQVLQRQQQRMGSGSHQVSAGH